MRMSLGGLSEWLMLECVELPWKNKLEVSSAIGEHEVAHALGLSDLISLDVIFPSLVFTIARPAMLRSRSNPVANRPKLKVQIDAAQALAPTSMP
jgi:hypothetical protein